MALSAKAGAQMIAKWVPAAMLAQQMLA